MREKGFCVCFSILILFLFYKNIVYSVLSNLFIHIFVLKYTSRRNPKGMRNFFFLFIIKSTCAALYAHTNHVLCTWDIDRWKLSSTPFQSRMNEWIQKIIKHLICASNPYPLMRYFSGGAVYNTNTYTHTMSVTQINISGMDGLGHAIVCRVCHFTIDTLESVRLCL